MNDFDKDLDTNRLLGMIDSNVDGKIEKSELRGQVGQMLLKYWDVLDKNHDGVLDKEELAAMQKMSGGQHRREDAAAQKPAPAASAATPTAGGK